MEKTSIAFIVTTLLIFVLPQVGIDLYLPALPPMQVDLGASQYSIQLSLTLYILTMGFFQLIYGPLSDRFGRKPIVLIGIAIFLVGCVVSGVATHVMTLLVGRVIQGIGMGAAFSVAAAIMGDVFEGDQLARMTAMSSIVYSTAPIVAPLLGGVLTQYVGWRMNFYAMAFMAAFLSLSIVLFVRETNQNPDPHAIHLIKLFKRYLNMLFHLRFMADILCLTLSFGITIVFNVIGPFLMQNILKVTPAYYGVLLFVLGVAYLLGTGCNRFLLKYTSSKNLTRYSLVAMLIACLGMLFTGLAGWFSVFSVTFWSFVIIFFSGFVFPNCFADALTLFPLKLGTASALIGALSLIGTSVISIIVAHIHLRNATPLAEIYLGITVLIMISFHFVAKWPMRIFR